MSLLNKVLRSKLVSTTADIEVQRQDPNSPLYSVKSFEELNLAEAVLKGVYGMGFNTPSKIQETALPLLLGAKPSNMIAQSQSGTGKTAAFALCLSPTLELAQQTGKVCKQMSKFLDIKIAMATRGEEHGRRREKKVEQIIIGTPGTILDWIRLKLFDPSKLGIFVLDEADVMIDTQGHRDQSIKVHRHLKKSAQFLLFSATYEDRVMKFAESIVPNPVIIRLKRSEESLSNIKQFYIRCQDRQEKFEALSNIYGTISIGQAMVFCHTKKSAQWLAMKMKEDGHAVALLTGDNSPEERMFVIDRYRSGKEKLLVTTNVCARGIDVEQVSVVINYDVPLDGRGIPDCETYLHRIGRTGRFGKKGIAINFVDSDRSFNNLKSIEKHFGRKINQIIADDPDQLEQLAD
ncbi:uncharacterized protein TRIADDRAFT_50410 [Trichoplax adhaerens]|uniref:RNA helicase n=1 Tax=Trichoplax adhaerens TaxID=10228 RepID=B3RZN1_TRIAD|nr:hypothetical protein TRIADDRAFT_50410 [Trichoplax adhaerens]EDV23869.1 hypothetical protein TRIADDRAFT_50410 [Trichoplax adhaerens]|eukprot:XP_002113395.1 hypothetical protein TRIADDRAFT_50410 [Trichoplax adhaerens]